MSSLQQLRGFFITGTDTGVGKTTIGAALVRVWKSQGRRVGAYKPVASGSVSDASGRPVWEDVEAYFNALDGEFPREQICPQRFLAPLAPPVAARKEGRTVNEELLLTGCDPWRNAVELTVVEGAGGFLSPLSGSLSNADLVLKLGWPLLIIGRLGLGTINHTLLTVEAAQRRKIPILGVVLNAAAEHTDDQSVETNPSELMRLCSVPILGVVPYSPQGDLLRSAAFLKITELLGQ